MRQVIKLYSSVVYSSDPDTPGAKVSNKINQLVIYGSSDSRRLVHPAGRLVVADFTVVRVLLLAAEDSEVAAVKMRKAATPRRRTRMPRPANRYRKKLGPLSPVSLLGRLLLFLPVRVGETRLRPRPRPRLPLGTRGLANSGSSSEPEPEPEPDSSSSDGIAEARLVIPDGWLIYPKISSGSKV